MKIDQINKIIIKRERQINIPTNQFAGSYD